MARGPLTAAELASYSRDGFVLARPLFDAREIELLEDAAILEAGGKRFADAGDVGWLDPGRDASARSLDRESR